jgi:RimJ/RimL family protein N-acetyltransferase
LGLRAVLRVQRSLHNLIEPAICMQPLLRTPRLSLRPFALTDAADVERLAGDFRVAETTAAIPHPYPQGAAATWIGTHRATFEARTGVIYAITDAVSDELLGAISLLEMSKQHARCEMGYWVAHSHWSQGVCSEAARTLIQYAHTELGITRVVARCLARNIGSARVMEKAGLVREGLLKKHVNHRGIFEDLLLYGMVLPGRGTSA